MQATSVAVILQLQSPYIYGHGRAAILQPHKTRAWRVCVMVRSAGI